MTFNIGFCGGLNGLSVGVHSNHDIRRRLTDLVSMIRASNCDLVILQEVDVRSRRSAYVNQCQTLIDGCGYKYSDFVANWHHPWVPYPSLWNIKTQFGPVHAGNLILSKHPIILTRSIPLARRHDQSAIYRWFYLKQSYQEVVISLPGKSVRFGNIHLDAFNRDTRASQAEDVVNAVSSSTIPTIIGGDFNSIGYKLSPQKFPDDPDMDYGDDVTMTLFHQAGFLGGAVSGDHQVPVYDFPAYAPNRQLSYILARGAVVSTIAAIPPIEASDHQAIVADVNLWL